MGLQLTFREKEEYLVLNLEDFRKEVMEGLREICGPEFNISERDVMKNNGVMLCGISIAGPDETVTPAIYLESFYSEYEQGKMNIKEVENEILKAYSAEKWDGEMSFDFISDFEEVKDRLIFRLINAEMNEELLKDTPHRRFLDLAVIYTVFVDGFFEIPGNIIVKNDLLDQWGVDEETLHEYAFINTPRIKTPVMKELSEMLLDVLGADSGLPEMDPDKGFLKMFVLTNCDKFYGDSPILYPGFLNGIRNAAGTDLFLLPSSVHEFIIIPDTGDIDPKELKDLVMSVNRSTVSKEEFLSDNVYVYRDGEISICT